MCEKVFNDHGGFRGVCNHSTGEWYHVDNAGNPIYKKKFKTPVGAAMLLYGMVLASIDKIGFIVLDPCGDGKHHVGQIIRFGKQFKRLVKKHPPV